ncbi:MAG: DUF4375 domain-containing protein, partial [Alphaproteobacteria bacterium]
MMMKTDGASPRSLSSGVGRTSRAMGAQRDSLVRACWKRLESRWRDIGFDGLDPVEREAIALYWLEAEVMNGGFEQYFSNSSGDSVAEAIRGLGRLSCTAT